MFLFLIQFYPAKKPPHPIIKLILQFCFLYADVTVARLTQLEARFMSCVKEEYRTNAVMHLMWKFIARYIDKHKIAYLFGCASLPGTDQSELELPLSYLHEQHKTPDARRPISESATGSSIQWLSK